MTERLEGVVVKVLPSGLAIIAHQAGGRRRHFFAPQHHVPPSLVPTVGRRVRFAAKRSLRRNDIAVDLEPADAPTGRVAVP